MRGLRRAGVGKTVDGDDGTPEADLVAMARRHKPVGIFHLLRQRRLMETRQNARASEGNSCNQKAPAFHRGHSPFDGFPIPTVQHLAWQPSSQTICLKNRGYCFVVKG